MTARSVRTACITATAAVAASLVLFGFVGSAGAQYNTTPTVSSSSSTVPAGGTTNLTATGFQPGSTVTFSACGKTLGTATANSSGTATLSVAITSA